MLCFDKGISEQYIWGICDRFYGVRKISYMFDKYDILKDKESFSDKADAVYNTAFKYRIEYDANKRKEYLKWVADCQQKK